MKETPTRFLNVFMDQNNCCNLRCRMCGFSDDRVADIKRHDMPFWLFERIAEDVFPRANYLALSCISEPFMTRDIPRRLDLLKRHPVPVTEIITNGTLLTRERIASVIENEVSRIGISVDGATSEVYEQIRVGAKFHRVIANIELLREMKAAAGSSLPALRLLHVISELNVDQFEKFLSLAESLGTKFVDVRTILPFKNATDRGTKEEAFWEKVARCREQLEVWTRRTGVCDLGYLRHQREPIDIFDERGLRRTCTVASENISILFNGDVVPCTAWSRPPLGNLAEQTLEEIWNGSAARSVRREFEERKPGLDCVYCTIVREDPEVEGDAFFSIINRTPPESPHS